jgi:hypothetical protein
MTAIEFLQQAPNEWPITFDGIDDPEELRELINELAGLSIRAARAYIYLDFRYWNDSHEGAVTAQNQATRKVRRGLGFNESHDIHF